MNIDKIRKRQFTIEYEISKIRKSLDITKISKEAQQLVKLYDEYVINVIKLTEDTDKRITRLERILK